jgi:hypothetical protein
VFPAASRPGLTAAPGYMRESSGDAIGISEARTDVRFPIPIVAEV